MRLFGFLRPHRTLVGQVEALEKRLAELEAVQLNRELQFEETRSRIQRYLSRIAALDQKAKDREGESPSRNGHDLKELIRLKYPKLGGE